jgi:hypothetical protein
MANKPKLYPHRRDTDGSYDSVRLTCFATVGDFKSKGKPADHREQHVCDSAFLAERGIFTLSKYTKQSARIRPSAKVYNQTGEAA